MEPESSFEVVPPPRTRPFSASAGVPSLATLRAPVPATHLHHFNKYGLAPRGGGMHVWMRDHVGKKREQNPYDPASLAKPPMLLPQDAPFDPCTDAFRERYTQDPGALGDHTYRVRRLQAPPTTQRNIGKGTYKRALNFKEPRLRERIAGYNRNYYNDANPVDWYRRLADTAFFSGLFMKRGDLIVMGDARGRDDLRELRNEIVVGFFMNTLVLRRLSTGFTLLVDWFRCTNMADETDNRERLREIAPHVDRQGRRVTGRRRARDQQYLIYERLRHDLMSHVASRAIGWGTGPNAQAAQPRAAFRFLRAGLFQVCHALAMGWRVRRFIHYDLHSRNILFSGRRQWMLEEARRPSADEASMDLLYVLDDAGHYAFRVPYPDTDGGRLVKLIDFGRSRARVSSRNGDPDGVDTVAGTRPRGGFGIDPRKTPRLYDLRRLVFDMVANGMEHGKWENIIEELTGEERRAFYAFIARALDLETVRVLVRSSWVTGVQAPLLRAGLLEEYREAQERWFRLVHQPPTEENDVALVNALFQLSHGKNGGRHRVDPKTGKDVVRPGRHVDYYVYQHIFFRAILRDDSRVGGLLSSSPLAKEHWEAKERRGELPAPVGWTAEAALRESALFAPYRLSGGLAEANALEEAGVVQDEWGLRPVRMNLTCREAGIQCFPVSEEEGEEGSLFTSR